MNVSGKVGISLAALAVAGLAAAQPAHAAETIGGSIVQRSQIDFIGGIYVFDGGFTQSGAVSSFEFFSGTNAINLLTPLILSGTAGNYTIAGIGDTITSNRTGDEVVPFILASGSALVGPGYTFGFKDGGVGATGNNPGTVTYDTYQSANFFYPSNLENVPVSVGQSVSVANGTLQNVSNLNGDRTYSIQFTATPLVSAVPEPGTLSLLVLGLGGMLLAARRRRQA